MNCKFKNEADLRKDINTGIGIKCMLIATPEHFATGIQKMFDDDGYTGATKKSPATKIAMCQKQLSILSRRHSSVVVLQTTSSFKWRFTHTFFLITV